MTEPQGYTQAVVDILNSQLAQTITKAFTMGEEHERERILEAVEKLKPFVDEQGQPNWYVHAAYIHAIKGKNE